MCGYRQSLPLRALCTMLTEKCRTLHSELEGKWVHPLLSEERPWSHCSQTRMNHTHSSSISEKIVGPPLFS